MAILPRRRRFSIRFSELLLIWFSSSGKRSLKRCFANLNSTIIPKTKTYLTKVLLGQQQAQRSRVCFSQTNTYCYITWKIRVQVRICAIPVPPGATRNQSTVSFFVPIMVLVFCGELKSKFFLPVVAKSLKIMLFGKSIRLTHYHANDLSSWYEKDT